MDGEKAAIYLGGAFMAVIVAWAGIAFLRSEGMIDWKLAAFSAAFVVANLVRRQIKKS
jgi:hypothetical protein